jgi:hypothetical protein
MTSPYTCAECAPLSMRLAAPRLLLAHRAALVRPARITSVTTAQLTYAEIILRLGDFP